MVKRTFICVLCIILVACTTPIQGLAEAIPEVAAPTNTVGEIGGYLSGNSVSVHQLYNDRKFNYAQGHGFAAERGNNLIDSLKGSVSTVVGDNNIKDGADRMIINRGGTITWIQDKYYSTASGSVNAAFDSTTGKYRYVDSDGTPMNLEVPADQYEKAVAVLRDKIQNGQLDNCGVTDPDEATNIIKKGNLTYKQAVNLTKAGTIESLTYDAAAGTVSATCAAGISFALDYASGIMNGIEPAVALKNAGMNGLKTGSIVFATYIISSQLVKTGLPNALAPTAEAIAKTLGKDVCEAILLKSGATVTKDVVKGAAQIISSSLIVEGVFLIVLTSADVVELFQGRISKEELLKNLTVTIIGVAIGAAGAVGGAALGALIVPGAGAVIGGILGDLVAGTIGTLAAEALIAPFYESDAEEMFEIINAQFTSLCSDYLISEGEATNIIEKLKSKLVGDTLKDMYASDNREQFAHDLMEPLFEEQVAARTPLSLPSEAELRAEMKNSLIGVVFIH